MMRTFLATLAASAIAATVALACPDQKGKVIFEDKFTDDSGGWVLGAPRAEIKDNSMILRPKPPGAEETGTATISLNQTFAASDADYCVEFLLPKPPEPGNKLGFSVVFFSQDNSNYYLWGAYTNNSVQLSRLSSDKWSDIFTDLKPPVAVKLEPDAINSLRVVIKDTKLSLFLNGTLVKVIRVQTPAGELHFGVFAIWDKISSANPVVQVKSFKVTAGE